VLLKIVDKNGYIYSAEKDFIFSSYGTCGTDYTLVIVDPKARVAQLYDANHKEVDVPTIDYEWEFHPVGAKSGIDE
jgi:hypothetical protein